MLSGLAFFLSNVSLALVATQHDRKHPLSSDGETEAQRGKKLFHGQTTKPGFQPQEMCTRLLDFPTTFHLFLDFPIYVFRPGLQLKALSLIFVTEKLCI